MHGRIDHRPGHHARGRLNWTVKPGTPQLSYDHAVAAYKAEYARRYEELMHGEPPAKP